MESSLYANEIGEGLPVLIIHGWQMDGKVEEIDFEPIFKTTTGLRRIYVDLPGMGKSPANGVKDQNDMYLQLGHFIDSRIGKSRFLLVGSSCGGYLARAIAQKYIQQVDGLLLRVPLIEPENSKRDVDECQVLFANEQVMSTLPAEQKALLGNIPIQTPAYLQALKAKYEDFVIRAAEGVSNEVLGPIRDDPKRYSLPFSLDTGNDKFFAPTLILCGRHDDTVGYRDSLRLLDFYPRSTYVVLDRGTHSLPVDEVGLFEALVRDWITRVNEWRARTV